MTSNGYSVEAQKTVSNGSNNERYNAPHLSEFYSIVNKKNANSHNLSDNSYSSSGNYGGIIYGDLKSTLNKSDLTHRRSYSIQSGVSTISDLRTLVTRRDIDNTTSAISELLKCSTNYSKSLESVSAQSSSMAHSLETLARLKGCNDFTAEKLLSASGLFHLLANHELIMSQVLSGLLSENIEEELDAFKLKSKSLENEFKKQCKEQSMKLKLQEKHNIELSRKKIRNILSYRESLSNLQVQLDQLETMRHDYYQDSYMLVESACEKVLSKVASTSRAQVEISENIARKGWSGGGLDDLLMNADDPFSVESDNDNEEDTVNENSIVTIHSNNQHSPQNPALPIENDVISSKKSESSYLSNELKNSQRETVNTDNNNQDVTVRFDVENAERQNNNETDSDSNFDNSFSLPLTVNSKKPKTNEVRQDNNDEKTSESSMLHDLETFNIKDVEDSENHEDAREPAEEDILDSESNI